MSEYNIQMNKYNALNAGYDQLYPATKIKNVNGLDTALQNKAPAGYGGFGEKIPHKGTFTSDESFVEWLTTEINSLPGGASEQVRFALYNYDNWDGGDWYGVLTNESGYGTLLVSSYGSTYGSNCQGQMIRQFVNNVWKPWEWVNPPMVIGVEYRTTERYLGKPVYVKAIDFGELPNTAWKHVDIDNQNRARAIRVGGLLNNGATIPGTDESQTNGSKPLQCYGYINSVCIYAPYDASSKTAVVTAWYTKTTD